MRIGSSLSGVDLSAQHQLLSTSMRLAESGDLEKTVAILDAAREVLGQMKIDLSSSLSTIRDTDVAQETSRYVREQILYQAGISTLMLAGKRSNMLLSLLRPS